MTCDCRLCCIFAVLTSNGGFVKVLRKKLHKSALSQRKRTPAGKCCIGCDVMRWFWKVWSGGWAGTGATIIKPKTLWECVQSSELLCSADRKKHSSHTKALATLLPNHTVWLCFPLYEHRLTNIVHPVSMHDVATTSNSLRENLLLVNAPLLWVDYWSED